MKQQELIERKELLIKKQKKEYTTRGNTQYCQKLFEEIQQIEEMLSKLSGNN